MPNLVQGVTKDNFTDIARVYSELNGGVHFGICLKPWYLNHVEMPATIPQWGAWRYYRWSRKMGLFFMNQRGKEGKSFTVPAEWPHLFDSDASVQEDYEIGERFRQSYKPEILHDDDVATRKAFIANLKLGFKKDDLKATW